MKHSSRGEFDVYLLRPTFIDSFYQAALSPPSVLSSAHRTRLSALRDSQSSELGLHVSSWCLLSAPSIYLYGLIYYIHHLLCLKIS